ncbi:MAG: hypothetical protein IT243_06665 [Bacteroidia bacterium]|nr:hypothetical protein [Bacteroidia bacterium]
MKENCNGCMNRPKEEMVMWAMILGNLFFGYLLATMLSWANANSFMSGLIKGGTFGLLLALGMDFQFWSMTTWFSNMTAMIVDIIVNTVMMAVAGGAVGYMLGRGGTTETA